MAAAAAAVAFWAAKAAAVGLRPFVVRGYLTLVMVGAMSMAAAAAAADPPRGEVAALLVIEAAVRRWGGSMDINLVLLLLWLTKEAAADEMGGRPTRPPVLAVVAATSSQSRDRRGLPTLPLRMGGVAPVPVAPDVLISFCQSCSHTRLPASM